GRPTSAMTGIIVEASLLNFQSVTALHRTFNSAVFRIQTAPESQEPFLRYWPVKQQALNQN
ncbi:hypothetical protein MY066_11330, partial [Yersinia pestis subsp. pestis]|uniref:hypothetical protein n=1 Tax=Yersinia pestis TaxID=632 RepID=UPI0021F30050